MRLLISGFEPWHDPVNPAWEVAKALPKAHAGCELRSVLLRVAAADAERALRESIESFEPDAVVLLGQSGRSQQLEVERIAVNLDDYRVEDNDGALVVNRPIEAGAPDGLFATLPVVEMVSAIRGAGVPAALSLTAGTHLCNHMLYWALRYAQRNRPGMMCGFIHLPFLPEQLLRKGSGCCMSGELMLRGVLSAIEAIGEYAR
ncbi:MAG: pyroglutamyl-peptidase I [Clostridia bacterium]|nr:pyroglutamyl-peptidase I [Clostridia bacterium]